ncbi:MAG: hypothetical protein JW738_03075 [Actinobacteria bacterium]|nr:hypothetical protein [Actinomycetota bacterium]
MKTRLVRNVLFLSGICFCLVGVVILLFANRMVGVVFIVAGFIDLTTSFLLPRLMEMQASGSSENSSDNSGR